jgi:hypothetical protein
LPPTTRRMPESKIDTLLLFFKFRAGRRLAACFFQAMIANCWRMQSDFTRRMLARQASAGDEDPVPEEPGFRVTTLSRPRYRLGGGQRSSADRGRPVHANAFGRNAQRGRDAEDERRLSFNAHGVEAFH